MAGLLPRALMVAALASAWMLLQRSAGPGTLVVGLLLGLLLAWFTSPFRPNRRHLRHPLLVFRYLGLVLVDIVQANLDVARIVLFKPNRELKPAFMTVPLDLRTPEAITALAATITLTPGTLSADLSADGRALLIHGLDVPDPAATVADIKRRYETKLMAIFE